MKFPPDKLKSKPSFIAEFDCNGGDIGKDNKRLGFSKTSVKSYKSLKAAILMLEI